MKNRHWLRYGDSCYAFVLFEVRGDSVYVHGPQGAASYIDREMPKEEARRLYADLRKEGYEPCDAKAAPSRLWWFWN